MPLHAYQQQGGLSEREHPYSFSGVQTLTPTEDSCYKKSLCTKNTGI